MKTKSAVTVLLWTLLMPLNVWSEGKSDEAEVILRDERGFLSIAWSPDGKLLASGHYAITGRGLYLWDAKTGKKLPEFEGHAATVYHVCFSPDGTLIASASRDGTVRLWNVAQRELVRTLTILKGDGEVRAVAFSPDGKMLASSGGFSEINLWDVKTGAHQATLSGNPKYIFTIAFSSDGHLVATCGNSSQVHIWDVKTREQLETIDAEVGNRSVSCIGFMNTRNGETLITTGRTRKAPILFWTVNPSRRFPKFQPRRGVNSIDVSADSGLLLVSVNALEYQVELFDIATGTVRRTFGGFKGAVYSAAFSPDTQKIVAASSDGTARIWSIADVVSGKGNRKRCQKQEKVSGTCQERS